MDQQLYEIMYNEFYRSGLMNNLVEKNSCDYHSITHNDTEILGAFCDMTGIHNEKLKRILLLGYMANMEGS